MDKTLNIEFNVKRYGCMTKDMIEVGTIVILKSGSPYMTVQKLIGDDTVECCWFTKSKTNSHLKVSTFKRTALLTFIPHTWEVIEKIHNEERPNTTPPMQLRKEYDSITTIFYTIIILLFGVIIGANIL